MYELKIPKSEENLNTPQSIRTFTGKYVNVFDPDPDTICIEDIAHGLSNLCRWGGQCPRFYSVAEHSIHCADVAPDHLKLETLLHDSGEAFMVDIPRPIKREFKNYRETEDNLLKVIYKKFGIDWPMHEMVKQIDQEMLEYEWDYFILEDTTDLIKGADPNQAKKMFLNAFKEYSR